MDIEDTISNFFKVVMYGLWSLFIIGAFMHFTGCDAPVPKSEEELARERQNRALSHLTYVKDTRTNLCFAGVIFGEYSDTLTNVPCSPEVEKVARPFTSSGK